MFCIHHRVEARAPRLLDSTEALLDFVLGSWCCLAWTPAISYTPWTSKNVVNTRGRVSWALGIGFTSEIQNQGGSHL